MKTCEDELGEGFCTIYVKRLVNYALLYLLFWYYFHVVRILYRKVKIRGTL